MSAERRYELDAWREPALEAGDTSIYSEHGRVLYPLGQPPEDTHNGVCYRAYWVRLVRAEYGGYFLLVKHGGGEERMWIGYNNRIVKALESMDSDNRFFMLHAMMSMHHKAEREAADKTAAAYRKAFAEGRLKKRKNRGQDSVRVWIDRAPILQS